MKVTVTAKVGGIVFLVFGAVVVVIVICACCACVYACRRPRRRLCREQRRDIELGHRRVVLPSPPSSSDDHDRVHQPGRGEQREGFDNRGVVLPPPSTSDHARVHLPVRGEQPEVELDYRGRVLPSPDHARVLHSPDHARVHLPGGGLVLPSPTASDHARVHLPGGGLVLPSPTASDHARVHLPGGAVLLSSPSSSYHGGVHEPDRVAVLPSASSSNDDRLDALGRGEQRHFERGEPSAVRAPGTSSGSSQSSSSSYIDMTLDARGRPVWHLGGDVVIYELTDEDDDDVWHGARYQVDEDDDGWLADDEASGGNGYLVDEEGWLADD